MRVRNMRWFMIFVATIYAMVLLLVAVVWSESIVAGVTWALQGLP